MFFPICISVCVYVRVETCVLWNISLRCVTFIYAVRYLMMQRCVAFFSVAFVYLCEAVILFLSKTPDWSNRELNIQ